MSIEDLRAVDKSSPIDTDVCLIGSGPAGWTLAEELRESGLRILLVESGGLAPGLDAWNLNEIDSIGAPSSTDAIELWAVRHTPGAVAAGPSTRSIMRRDPGFLPPAGRLEARRWRPTWIAPPSISALARTQRMARASLREA